MHYAELCLSEPPRDLPFFMGYSHEALFRAAHVGCRPGCASEHLRFARGHVAGISDERERGWLEQDLEDLGSLMAGG